MGSRDGTVHSILPNGPPRHDSSCLSNHRGARACRMPPSLGPPVGSGHLRPFRLGAPVRPSCSRSAGRWGSAPSVAPSLEGNRRKPRTSQREGADQGFTVGTRGHTGVGEDTPECECMVSESVGRWPRGAGGECPGAHSSGDFTQQEWTLSCSGSGMSEIRASVGTAASRASGEGPCCHFQLLWPQEYLGWWLRPPPPPVLPLSS